MMASMTDSLPRLSASQAAARLGVRQQTLYAYVSRGLLSRERDAHGSTFDPLEVEAFASSRRRSAASPSGTASGSPLMVLDTDIALIEDGELYFRGVPASELALGASFESVARWLWGAPAVSDDELRADADAVASARAAVAALPPSATALDRLQVAVPVLGASDPTRHDLQPATVRAAAERLIAGVVEGLLGGGAAAERGGEPGARRTVERGAEPGAEQNGKLGPESVQERGAGRDALQIGGLGPEPGGERDAERGGEPRGERSAERGGEPRGERNAEPGQERGSESRAESGAELGTNAGAEPRGRASAGPEQTAIARPQGIAAALWRALAGRPASAAQLRAMNAALVLLVDHDLAASTMAVRAAASARATPYAVASSGLGALDSALHGNASGAAAELIRLILDGTDARTAIAHTVARTARPAPGFGQPLYPGIDARAAILLPLVAAMPGGDSIVDAVDALTREVVSRTGRHPNVDLALAALATAAGMPADAGAAIFAVGRMAGWIAHALDEYGQQPLRLRPRGRYVGPRPASGSTMRMTAAVDDGRSR
jgi:citrate synthase